jgi:hypothetical protein
MRQPVRRPQQVVVEGGHGLDETALVLKARQLVPESLALPRVAPDEEQREPDPTAPEQLGGVEDREVVLARFVAPDAQHQGKVAQGEP